MRVPRPLFLYATFDGLLLGTGAFYRFTNRFVSNLAFGTQFGRLVIRGRMERVPTKYVRYGIRLFKDNTIERRSIDVFHQ